MNTSKFVFVQTGEKIQEILNKADSMQMATVLDIEDAFSGGTITDPYKILTLGGLVEYDRILSFKYLVIDCHLLQADEVEVPPGTFDIVKEHIDSGRPSDMVKLRMVDGDGTCQVLTLDRYNIGIGEFCFSAVGLYADSVSSIRLQEGDIASVSTLAPSNIILDGNAEYTVPANGRAVKKIPIVGIPPGYTFGAYRGISLNGVSGDGESFKNCAIQFFGSANGGTAANVAIKNFSDAPANLSVRINAMFTKIKESYS